MLELLTIQHCRIFDQLNSSAILLCKAFQNTLLWVSRISVRNRLKHSQQLLPGLNSLAILEVLGDRFLIGIAPEQMISP